MNKHEQALRDIKEVREKIKGLGFFGAAAISDGTLYDVYDDDYLNNGVIEHFTEQQLKGFVNG